MTAQTAHVAAGLAKIGLVLRQEAWRGRERHGLTPTQGQILALLRARGGLRLGEIAAGLGVTAPTASDSVAALAAKGLVDKRRGRGDGRGVSVELTGAGARAAEATAEWPDLLLAAIDELTPAERAVFLRGLSKMIRSLQEQGRIQTARMCGTCRYFRPFAHPDALRPHHCDYVDAAFGEQELRLDCAEHEQASGEQAAATWARFLGGAAA